MQGVSERIAMLNEGIIKQAFLIGAATAIAKPVLQYALKNPLKLLGAGLTAAQAAGAGRDASAAASGARNVYHNFEQSRQFLGGPTM